MTLRWLRFGLFTFILLTGALAANLLLFQPLPGRAVAARMIEAPPPSFVLEADAAPIATGSVAVKAGSGIAKPAPMAVADSKRTDHPDVVRAIQRELNARGYETGTEDGVPGLVTSASIMAYESDHGLALTGQASEDILSSILLGGPGNAGASKTGAAARPSDAAEQVIRTVQQSLTSLGYKPGVTDGRLGAQTLGTIRDFEADQGLTVTGRISGQLVARLARLAGQGRLADGRGN